MFVGRYSYCCARNLCGAFTRNPGCSSCKKCPESIAIIDFNPGAIRGDATVLAKNECVKNKSAEEFLLLPLRCSKRWGGFVSPVATLSCRRRKSRRTGASEINCVEWILEVPACFARGAGRAGRLHHRPTPLTRTHLTFSARAHFL